METFKDIKPYLNSFQKYAAFEITEWEPHGQGSRHGEFAVRVGSSTIFCEVKSPSWRRSVYKREGKDYPLLKQIGYTSMEHAGSYDNTNDLKGAVTKADGQFPESQCCLLIMTDNLTVSLVSDFVVEGTTISAQGALYGEGGCFADNQFGIGYAVTKLRWTAVIT